MFSDPSLTADNLSTVLDSMREGLCVEFCDYVNIPDSEIMEISIKYGSDRERKEAFIPHLISTHPALSWTVVANALYQMGIYSGGDSCHRALDCLQQLFPTGRVHTVDLEIKSDK